MGYAANDELTAKWGQNVRRIRKELGLKQTDLAQCVGVHPTNFCRIENGKQRPSDEIRIRIAKALGRRVEEIFDYDGATA